MFLASACPQAYLDAVELRHLRYFVAVAEMENVSRAATQKLHVAQSSLSRQIRDLEVEIGVQLLERTAKSVRLTDAGRAFLEEVRAILKHADDAVLKVRFWPNRFPISQSLRSPVSESYLSRDLFHHRVHIGEVPDHSDPFCFPLIVPPRASTSREERIQRLFCFFFPRQQA